jgi:hypothetical protein
MNLNKSIEQLENDVWKEPKEFTTGLVERCHRYRKIPLGSLTNEQLRTLISQNIGTKYLLPVVLKILMDNPLAEGDLYEGDLLEATLKIDNSVWQRKQEYASQYRELIKNYESIIADELGEKTLKRLIEKIN